MKKQLIGLISKAKEEDWGEDFIFGSDDDSSHDLLNDTIVGRSRQISRSILDTTGLKSPGFPSFHEGRSQHSLLLSMTPAKPRGAFEIRRDILSIKGELDTFLGILKTIQINPVPESRPVSFAEFFLLKSEMTDDPWHRALIESYGMKGNEKIKKLDRAIELLRVAGNSSPSVFEIILRVSIARQKTGDQTMSHLLKAKDILHSLNNGRYSIDENLLSALEALLSLEIAMIKHVSTVDPTQSQDLEHLKSLMSTLKILLKVIIQKDVLPSQSILLEPASGWILSRLCKNIATVLFQISTGEAKRTTAIRLLKISLNLANQIGKPQSDEIEELLTQWKNLTSKNDRILEFDLSAEDPSTKLSGFSSTEENWDENSNDDEAIPGKESSISRRVLLNSMLRSDNDELVPQKYQLFPKGSSILRITKQPQPPRFSNAKASQKASVPIKTPREFIDWVSSLTESAISDLALDSTELSKINDYINYISIFSQRKSTENSLLKVLEYYPLDIDISIESPNNTASGSIFGAWLSISIACATITEEKALRFLDSIQEKSSEEFVSSILNILRLDIKSHHTKDPTSRAFTEIVSDYIRIIDAGQTNGVVDNIERLISQKESEIVIGGVPTSKVKRGRASLTENGFERILKFSESASARRASVRLNALSFLGSRSNEEEQIIRLIALSSLQLHLTGLSPLNTVLKSDFPEDFPGFQYFEEGTYLPNSLSHPLLEYMQRIEEIEILSDLMSEIQIPRLEPILNLTRARAAYILGAHEFEIGEVSLSADIVFEGLYDLAQTRPGAVLTILGQNLLILLSDALLVEEKYSLGVCCLEEAVSIMQELFVEVHVVHLRRLADESNSGGDWKRALFYYLRILSQIAQQMSGAGWLIDASSELFLVSSISHSDSWSRSPSLGSIPSNENFLQAEETPKSTGSYGGVNEVVLVSEVVSDILLDNEEFDLAEAFLKHIIGGLVATSSRHSSKKLESQLLGLKERLFQVYSKSLRLERGQVLGQSLLLSHLSVAKKKDVNLRMLRLLDSRGLVEAVRAETARYENNILNERVAPGRMGSVIGGSSKTPTLGSQKSRAYNKHPNIRRKESFEGSMIIGSHLLTESRRQKLVVSNGRLLEFKVRANLGLGRVAEALYWADVGIATRSDDAVGQLARFHFLRGKVLAQIAQPSVEMPKFPMILRIESPAAELSLFSTSPSKFIDYKRILRFENRGDVLVELMRNMELAADFFFSTGNLTAQTICYITIAESLLEVFFTVIGLFAVPGFFSSAFALQTQISSDSDEFSTPRPSSEATGLSELISLETIEEYVTWGLETAATIGEPILILRGYVLAAELYYLKHQLDRSLAYFELCRDLFLDLFGGRGPKHGEPLIVDQTFPFSFLMELKGILKRLVRYLFSGERKDLLFENLYLLDAYIFLDYQIAMSSGRRAYAPQVVAETSQLISVGTKEEIRGDEWKKDEMDVLKKRQLSAKVARKANEKLKKLERKSAKKRNKMLKKGKQRKTGETEDAETSTVDIPLRFRQPLFPSNTEDIAPEPRLFFKSFFNLEMKRVTGMRENLWSILFRIRMNAKSRQYETNRKFLLEWKEQLKSHKAGQSWVENFRRAQRKNEKSNSGMILYLLQIDDLVLSYIPEKQTVMRQVLLSSNRSHDVEMILEFVESKRMTGPLTRETFEDKSPKTRKKMFHGSLGRSSKFNDDDIYLFGRNSKRKFLGTLGRHRNTTMFEGEVQEHSKLLGENTENKSGTPLMVNYLDIPKEAIEEVSSSLNDTFVTGKEGYKSVRESVDAVSKILSGVIQQLLPPVKPELGIVIRTTRLFSAFAYELMFSGSKSVYFVRSLGYRGSSMLESVKNATRVHFFTFKGYRDSGNSRFEMLSRRKEHVRIGFKSIFGLSTEARIWEHVDNEAPYPINEWEKLKKKKGITLLDSSEIGRREESDEGLDRGILKEMMERTLEDGELPVIVISSIQLLDLNESLVNEMLHGNAVVMVVAADISKVLRDLQKAMNKFGKIISKGVGRSGNLGNVEGDRAGIAVRTLLRAVRSEEYLGGSQISFYVPCIFW